jgi:hypothetical protein
MFFKKFQGRRICFCKGTQTNQAAYSPISQIQKFCRVKCFFFYILPFRNPIPNTSLSTQWARALHNTGPGKIRYTFSAGFRQFLQEPPKVAQRVLILHPTVWLDGAGPANTCILPTIAWNAPTHRGAYPPLQYLAEIGRKRYIWGKMYMLIYPDPHNTRLECLQGTNTLAFWGRIRKLRKK